MIRILSSKRYWSLIGKIADLQETVKNQADTINKQQQAIEYVNKKLNKRNIELLKLRQKLYDNGIIVTDSGIDFPATTKINPGPASYEQNDKCFKDAIENINKIFGLKGLI